MYFAYGFPKSFQLGDAEGSSPDVLYTSFGGDILIVATTTSLQVWSGGQQRLKLGELVRDSKSLEEEGNAVCACWCPSRRVITVATDLGFLQFYGLLPTKEVLWECPDGQDARRISIYLQNSVSVHPPIDIDSNERIAGLCGDGKSVLVALKNGTFLVYSWQAKLRCSASPLFVSASNSAGRHRLRRQSSSGQRLSQSTATSADPLGRTSSTAESAELATLPFPLSDLYDVDLPPLATPVAPQEAVTVRHIAYAPAAGLLSLVLYDGRAALISFPEGGLAAAEQARLLRWVYRPTSPTFAAVSAAVQPSGHYMAVGLAHGRVAMFSMASIVSGRAGAAAGSISNIGSLAPEDSKSSLDINDTSAALQQHPSSSSSQVVPDRVLSLTEWGYSSSLVGAAHLLQWSPDGRVLAVGYARRGVAAWTPSGCRVMCSLRQAAQGMVGPGLAPEDRRHTSDGIESFAGGSNDFEAAVGSPSELNPQHTRPASDAGVLERGASALGWSSNGYSLIVAEFAGTTTTNKLPSLLLEIPFARSIQGHHRVSEPPLGTSDTIDTSTGSETGAGGNPKPSETSTSEGVHSGADEFFVLQGADRLLLISETVPASAAAARAGLLGPAAHEALLGQQPDLMLHHIRLPQQYLDSAFPLLHAAPAPDGRDIAVAGARGLAVFTPRTRRWRLFGDAMQERRIKVHSLAWLPGGIVAACAMVDDNSRGSKGAGAAPAKAVAGVPSPAVLFYPRHHLDASSLLARYSLPQLPTAMDTVGSFLALAFDPLQITVLRAESSGGGGASGDRLQLHAVRELSIMGLGGPLLDMTLLAPPAPKSSPRGSRRGSRRNSIDSKQENEREEAPSHCVLFRGGGILSVLDMQQGTEVVLSDEIEAYWLPSTPGAVPLLAPIATAAAATSPGLGLARSLTPTSGLGRDDSAASMLQPSPAAKGAAWLEKRTSDVAALAEAAGDMAAILEEEAVRVEMPWWTYGSRGMQLWFPSTFSDPELSPGLIAALGIGGGPLAAVAGARGGGSNATDPELEFDREVYPLGVSLSEVSIVGVTQRTARSQGFSIGSPAALSFHPHPESQPVLPCLLRRLLEQGQAADALELAMRHSRGPHFARSLEWLLFTTLESDADLQKEAFSAAAAAGASGGTPGGTRRVRFQWPDGQAPSDVPFTPKSGARSEKKRACAGPLLIAAARLVQQFPQAAEIIVSVARKTDAQLWPALFAAAGSPAELCDGLLGNGALQSAACCLLIVDRVEGAPQAHHLALRLVRAALSAGRYELVADLLRFLLPPGEGEIPGLMGQGFTGLSLDGRASTPESQEYRNGNFNGAGGGGGGGGGDQQGERQGQGEDNGGYASWLWSYFSGADKAASPPSSKSAGKQNTYSKIKGDPTAALHRAVSAASLAEDSDEGQLHNLNNLNLQGEMTPAIHAWRAMGTHAWKLLDAGALRELADMGISLGDLHGGLAAVLSTTAADVPLSLGHTTPSAAAIASALFVASNEFAAADSDTQVALAAEALLHSCHAAGCANHAAALALVMGDANHVDSFSSENPRVWAVLQDLIVNDVHLCSYTSIVSPPGTPLVLTAS